MDAINDLSCSNTVDLIGAKTADSPVKKQPASQPRQLAGAFLALLLFMFIYFARPEDWIRGLAGVPVAKVTGVLAFLALLFSLRHIRQRFPREVLYLALLIGQLFLASLLSSVWRGGALSITFDFAKVLMVILVMIVAVNTSLQLRLLIFTQAASVTAIAAVTLWKGHLLQGRLEGMLGGNYTDPNDLALAFVVSLPLCIGLLFLTKSWAWKAVWASAIVMMTYAIFLTGSRGGFLSLIVTAVACLWQFAVRGRRPYVLFLVPLVFIMVMLPTRGILVGRLKGTFNIQDDISAAYGSAHQRLELFWRSVDITNDHPLFGVGPGNFALISGNWHVAHNSFTQMSSEGGIPAFILYVLILWSGFKNIRATKRLANRQREITLLAKALHASLIGYTVASCFLSVSFAFFPYFLVSYTTALLLIAKKSAARSKQSKSASRALLHGPIDSAILVP